jgi:hypothetical protein
MMLWFILYLLLVVLIVVPLVIILVINSIPKCLEFFVKDFDEEEYEEDNKI